MTIYKTFEKKTCWFSQLIVLKSFLFLLKWQPSNDNIITSDFVFPCDIQTEPKYLNTTDFSSNSVYYNLVKTFFQELKNFFYKLPGLTFTVKTTTSLYSVYISA